MRWNKFTITTTTMAEDIISAMLGELGIEGVEIENHVPLTEEETKGMFIDFPPELPPDNGESKVSFYLEEKEDASEILKKVRAALEEERQFMDIGSGEITCGQTEDLDWVNNWKEFFHSFRIGDILIKPTWEPLQEDGQKKTVIEIDPGISFGTGKHETTQLCIRQLQKYLKEGHMVLDVGCGSGILSIAALKLGASNVVGTDIDENCLTSTKENFKVNGLDLARGSFYLGNLIDDVSLQQKVGTSSFDIVVANILADVIIPMASVIPDRLKSGGIFITSGIIDFKEQEVRKAIEGTGLEILEINHEGEWVNITARKK